MSQDAFSEKSEGKLNRRSKGKWQSSPALRFFVWMLGGGTFLLCIILILENKLSGYQAALSGLASTLLTAFLIAVLTRLGALEDRAKLHDDTRRELLDRIREAREDIVERTSEKFEARYKWGLEKIDNRLDEQFEFSHYSNCSIKWINTKFHDVEKRIKEIDAALEGGNKVKLLMIHPNCANAIDRGYYTFEKDEEENSASFEDSKDRYYREMIECAISFVKIYHNKKKNFVDDFNKPLFQLRFYDDAPSMPMLLCKNSRNIKIGFTGFYLDSFSRNLPYLRWSGRGKEYMTEHLFKYFDRKWDYAERFDAENFSPTNMQREDFIWDGPFLTHAPIGHPLLMSDPASNPWVSDE